MKVPKDVREHIKNLEERGLLIRVKRPTNKDTEIHPIVRWQFRGGIREEDRKAFLFENVVDGRRKYKGSVLVGGLAASRWVYGLGMGCEPAEIVQKWQHALAHPIEPVMVASGPVQEEIHIGDELDQEGMGLDEIAVPISTPGFDNAPYFTCAQWITKDLETGIRNVGNLLSAGKRTQTDRRLSRSSGKPTIEHSLAASCFKGKASRSCSSCRWPAGVHTCRGAKGALWRR